MGKMGKTGKASKAGSEARVEKALRSESGRVAKGKKARRRQAARERQKGSRPRSGAGGGASDDAAFGALLVAAQTLESQLRALDDLPLAVTSVALLDPAFRSTALRPPRALRAYNDKASPQTTAGHQFPGPGQPVLANAAYEVVLRLELSGKWPREEEAMRHCQTAFLGKVGQLLWAQHHVPSVLSDSRLLVCASGFGLSLTLSQERLLSLLEARLKDLQDAGAEEDGELRELRDRVQALDRDVNRRPKLCAYLKNEVGVRPHLAETIRLTKRWVAANMLSLQVPEEVVEVLAASLPQSFASAADGFRSVLTLLSTHDFLRKPVVGNFNELLSLASVEEARRKMVTERPRYPVLVLVTPVDEEGHRWSRLGPDPPTLARLKQLARSALEAPQLDPAPPAPLSLFPLRLRLHALPSAPPLLTETPTKALPPAPFQPQRLFVEALRANWGHLAAFFWDAWEGRDVGVLWRPEALAPHKPALRHLPGRLLRLDDDAQETLRLHKPALLHDIRQLGRGILQDIVTAKQ